LRKQFDKNKTSIPERTETVIRLLKQKSATTQPYIIDR
jgi:hypothetical protein